MKGLLLFVLYFVVSCNTSSHPRHVDLEKVPLDYVSFETLFFGDLDTPLKILRLNSLSFFLTKRLTLCGLKNEAIPFSSSCLTQPNLSQKAI
jgi:hypothetical protein